MDRAIAAFDIETVPDTEVGRRLNNLSGDFITVADAMQQRRREETDGASDFLKPPYHRIVTISVAWLDLNKQQFKLASLGSDPLDEGDLLAAFFKILDKAPRLISWNGSSFDVPVLRYRALLHGIDASNYYNGGDRHNNYINRYHDLHTDLCDVLAGFNNHNKIGLDALCQLIGLPGKTVTEGHCVFQHIARGEWDLVKTYCELDALNTLMLYLAYDKSRGVLTMEQFDQARTIIINSLNNDPRPDVHNYATALRTWQLGQTRRHLLAELGHA